MTQDITSAHHKLRSFLLSGQLPSNKTVTAELVWFSSRGSALYRFPCVNKRLRRAKQAWSCSDGFTKFPISKTPQRGRNKQLVIEHDMEKDEARPPFSGKLLLLPRALSLCNGRRFSIFGMLRSIRTRFSPPYFTARVNWSSREDNVFPKVSSRVVLCLPFVPLFTQSTLSRAAIRASSNSQDSIRFSFCPSFRFLLPQASGFRLSRGFSLKRWKASTLFFVAQFMPQRAMQ